MTGPGPIERANAWALTAIAGALLLALIGIWWLS